MDDLMDNVEIAQCQMDDACMAMTLIVELLDRESLVDEASREPAAAVALFRRMRFFLAVLRTVLNQMDEAKAQIDSAVEQWTSEDTMRTRSEFNDGRKNRDH